MNRFTLALVVVTLAMGCRAARADCEQHMEQLAGLLPQLPDGHVKYIVMLDINFAVRELEEDDEFECMLLVDHAVRVIKTAPQDALPPMPTLQPPRAPIPAPPSSQNVTRTPP